MNRRLKCLLGLAIISLIVFAGTIFFRHPKSIQPDTTKIRPVEIAMTPNPAIGPSGPQQPDPMAGGFNPSGTGMSTGAAFPASVEVVRQIKERRVRLEQKKQSQDQQAEIRDLFDYLGSIDMAAVVPAITEFLKSREDVPMLSGIEVGPRGVESWSSFRVALLDFLGAAVPPVAAEYAKTIFATSDSPDEWAVSLRNTARVVPPNDPYLTAKTIELLTKQNWAQNPTNGYLQAYDLAVHTGDPQFIPILEQKMKNGNQAVRQASVVALERLATTHTLTMLDTLQSNNGLLATSPMLRAAFYSRANVGDPAERTLVESYLLRPDVSPAEIERFAALFPNQSAALSHNLVTQTKVPNLNDQATQDVVAQGVVAQWLQNAKFASVKAVLTSTEQRLRTFVEQATTANLLNSR